MIEHMVGEMEGDMVGYMIGDMVDVVDAMVIALSLRDAFSTSGRQCSSGRQRPCCGVVSQLRAEHVWRRSGAVTQHNGCYLMAIFQSLATHQA